MNSDFFLSNKKNKIIVFRLKMTKCVFGDLKVSITFFRSLIQQMNINI